MGTGVPTKWEHMSDCIFCKIVTGAIPAHKIYETDSLLAFLDINPTNPGHTLVIPKTHYDQYTETPLEMIADLVATIRKIVPVILQVVGATGWNLGVNSGRDAGQIIFHTHFHVIPRFPDDGYRHWKGKAEYTDQLLIVAEKIRQQLG